MTLLRAWLARRSHTRLTAREIYGSIVAAGRQIIFYETQGVPDTREGRFEMIALHVALVMLRLQRIGSDGVHLGRGVAEAFIGDMDDNMREIGIGDLAVPRKIKRAGAALFDRHRDYGRALAAEGLVALEAAIGDALTAAGAGPGLDRPALARYTKTLAAQLTATSDADCLAGRVTIAPRVA